MSSLTFTRRAGRLLALSAALWLAGVAQAVPEARFQDAYAQFTQAQGGSDAAIERAAKTFAALSQGEPGEPVLLAYAGASNAMLAGTTIFPWKKMSYAEDGMAMLDKALALVSPTQEAPAYGGLPAALNVRFVAANTFLAVPRFMNRAAQGRKLLDEVLASPLFAKAPVAFQGRVWLRAAQLAEVEQRPQDARKYLNLVIDSQGPQAEAARARLKGLAP